MFRKLDLVYLISAGLAAALQVMPSSVREANIICTVTETPFNLIKLLTTYMHADIHIYIYIHIYIHIFTYDMLKNDLKWCPSSVAFQTSEKRGWEVASSGPTWGPWGPQTVEP